MWADNEVTLDLRNVRHITDAVITLIDSDHLAPVTVGVFGDWGSGKSSILRMVKASLESRKDDGILCVWFNGWQFESYDDAKASLIGTILDALRTERGALTKAKEQFLKMIKKIRWLRLMGFAGKGLLRVKLAALTGGLSEAGRAIAVAGKAQADEAGEDELEKLIDPSVENEAVPSSVRDFHDNFEELLKQTGIRRLVVFIDDLDRCFPDRVVDTLEAIKLFLSVPRTAFVIGADEALVRRAVQARLGAFAEAKEQLGRDYLEKLIQVPVHVPPMNAQETEGYMNLLFAQLRLDQPTFEGLCAKRAEATQVALGDDMAFGYESARALLGALPGALEADFAMVGQIGGVLAAEMGGNPRQTKRFLNTLLLRLRMAQARGLALDQRVMAKLMLLEYTRAEAFATLGEWQRGQFGKAIEIRRLEESLALGEHGSEASGDEARESSSGVATRDKGTSDVRKTANALPTQAEPWLADPWLKRWLELEPALATIDLGPYFYFAKQRGAPTGGPVQRMTPIAREVYDLLQSPAESVRITAKSKAATLVDAEASAVLSALLERAPRLTASELGGDGSALLATFDLVEKKPDLRGELISALARLTPGIVPVQVVTRIVAMARSTPHVEAAERLLQLWQGNQANSALRIAAGQQLPRLRVAAPTAGQGR